MREKKEFGLALWRLIKAGAAAGRGRRQQEQLGRCERIDSRDDDDDDVDVGSEDKYYIAVDELKLEEGSREMSQVGLDDRRGESTADSLDQGNE